MNELKNTLNEIFEEIAKAKMPGGFSGAKMKVPGVKSPKMTVYWQGTGKRRPLQINVGSPIPQGYGTEKKMKETDVRPAERGIPADATKGERAGTEQAKIADKLQKQVDQLQEQIKEIKQPKQDGEPQQLVPEQKISPEVVEKQRADFVKNVYGNDLVSRAKDSITNLLKKLTPSNSNKLDRILKEQGMSKEQLVSKLNEMFGQTSLKLIDEANTRDEFFDIAFKLLNERENLDTNTKLGVEREQAINKELEKGKSIWGEDAEKVFIEKKHEEASQKRYEELLSSVEKGKPEISTKIRVDKNKLSRDVKVNTKKYDLDDIANSTINADMKSVIKELGLRKKKKWTQIINIDTKTSETLDSIDLRLPKGMFPSDIKRNAEQISVRLTGEELPLNIKATGKDTVRIEIPKSKDRARVATFRDYLDSTQSYITEYSKSHNGDKGLIIPISRTSDGETQFVNYADAGTPHLCGVGQTGKGKTVLVKTLIAGIKSSYSPDEVEMHLISGSNAGFETEAGSSYLKGDIIKGSDTKDGAINIVNKLDSIVSDVIAREKILKKYGVDNIDRLPGKNAYMKRSMIIFDEAQIAYGNILRSTEIPEQEKKKLLNKFDSNMNYILTQARKVGVHLNFFGQDANPNTKEGKWMKEKMMRSQIKMMIGADESTSRAVSGSSKMSRNFKLPGQIYLKNGLDDWTFAQGAFTKDSDLEEINRETNK